MGRRRAVVVVAHQHREPGGNNADQGCQQNCPAQMTQVQAGIRCNFHGFHLRGHHSAAVVQIQPLKLRQADQAAQGGNARADSGNNRLVRSHVRPECPGKTGLRPNARIGDDHKQVQA
jgi:hypothetical protein